MRFVEAKCKNCHADLEVDLDNLMATCPYCKSKLVLEFDVDRYLENKEETIREQNRLRESTIQKEQEYKYLERTKKEEAKRRKLEAKQRKEELKYAERKDRREKTDLDFANYLKFMIVILLFIACMGLVFHFIDLSEEKTHQEKEDIKIPISSEEIKDGKYNYKEVQEMFESAGFTNVVLEKDEDIKIGLLKKEDLVEKVTVDGKKSFEKDSWVEKDTRVVITYHAKKEKD